MPRRVDRRFFLLAFLVVIASCSGSHPSKKIASDGWPPAARYLAEHPAAYSDVERSSFYLTMRDGVKIAVNLTLPEGLKSGEKIPAIMQQTRYWRALDIGWPLSVPARRRLSRDKFFVERGYAWVSLDVRGSGASFGRWPYPWAPDEVRDGGEVVNWIVRQPWSNGRVGAMGISYVGSTAEFLLVNKNPAVKAVAPLFSLFDAYTDIAFPGGIHNAWFTRLWNEGNHALDRDDLSEVRRDAPWWAWPFLHGVQRVDADRDGSLLAQAIRQHEQNIDIHAAALQTTYRDDKLPGTDVTIDDFSPFHYLKQTEASGAAVYSWSGWFDGAYPGAAIKRFLTLTNPKKLVLGPWNHGGAQDASPFSSSRQSAFGQNAELLRYFDYYLKAAPNGFTSEKPVLYFTMGEERWKTADTWPPAGSRIVSFYFDADHRLTTAEPSEPLEDAGVDAYAVNPSAGTGEQSRWNTQATGGDVKYPDRREEDRKLLCYTSAPLESDTEVTGHPLLTLDLSSTANDGEFFAYLEDVDPTGRVTYVTEGELRAIDRRISPHAPPYRGPGPYHSFQRAAARPLAPGEPTELVFDMLPTSYLFKRGHSVRLALAGADKDHFAVLPGPSPAWRVFRDREHPSQIDLPVMTR